jgi:hypothetical protein
MRVGLRRGWRDEADAGTGACDDRGIEKSRGAGVVGPRMMEDTGLIRRSRDVGSWVSERKFMFAAIWYFGSWVSERK